MMAAKVVQAADVRLGQTAAGARVRTVLAIESSLTRRLVEVSPQASFAGVTVDGGELWFVLDGSGELIADGHQLRLRSGAGAWLPPGTSYRVVTDGITELRLDAVALPPGSGITVGGRAVTRDLADCPVETTGDRRFRVLFGPGRDCGSATQFVGEIPPGRAPEHSHPYDEVVLVLAGEGVIHAGAEHPLAAGTCVHLPPGQPHCLENTGATSLRVLGVFHPADSPATKTASPPA